MPVVTLTSRTASTLASLQTLELEGCGCHGHWSRELLYGLTGFRAAHRGELRRNCSNLGPSIVNVSAAIISINGGRCRKLAKGAPSLGLAPAVRKVFPMSNFPHSHKLVKNLDPSRKSSCGSLRVDCKVPGTSVVMASHSSDDTGGTPLTTVYSRP